MRAELADACNRWILHDQESFRASADLINESELQRLLRIPFGGAMQDRNPRPVIVGAGSSQQPKLCPQEQGELSFVPTF